MSKVITLRLNEKVYNKLRSVAERENRPISNFIETATMRFIEEYELVDEFEMAEIKGNRELNRSLKKAVKDTERRRGAFV